MAPFAKGAEKAYFGYKPRPAESRNMNKAALIILAFTAISYLALMLVRTSSPANTPERIQAPPISDSDKEQNNHEF